LNGDDFACHSGYRVRYRRTFGEGLSLDPLRNSDISSEILPNGQRIHRPRALTVIKFDPGKFHTVMSVGEFEFFRLRAAANYRHASIRTVKACDGEESCN
jgi:hypothetical protein